MEYGEGFQWQPGTIADLPAAAGGWQTPGYEPFVRRAQRWAHRSLVDSNRPPQYGVPLKGNNFILCARGSVLQLPEFLRGAANVPGAMACAEGPANLRVRVPRCQRPRRS